MGVVGQIENKCPTNFSLSPGFDKLSLSDIFELNQISLVLRRHCVAEFFQSRCGESHP